MAIQVTVAPSSVAPSSHTKAQIVINYDFSVLGGSYETLTPSSCRSDRRKFATLAFVLFLSDRRRRHLTELCDIIAENPKQFSENLAWICGRCPQTESANPKSTDNQKLKIDSKLQHQVRFLGEAMRWYCKLFFACFHEDWYDGVYFAVEYGFLTRDDDFYVPVLLRWSLMQVGLGGCKTSKKACEELFGSLLSGIAKIAVARGGQPLDVLLIRLKPLRAVLNEVFIYISSLLEQPNTLGATRGLCLRAYSRLVVRLLNLAGPRTELQWTPSLWDWLQVFVKEMIMKNRLIEECKRLLYSLM
ncbi:unnamed protein product [Thlaspi arvense]|uniref:PI4-kinase N-terminal domain-containing protein n=1 Tax=Thlaspi arvense TaxID=13288 RepID=A0AAU9T3A9_THLAR|nr:unnamed protein product [Thlaspi arvense]